jgi:hypothetical protein
MKTKTTFGIILIILASCGQVSNSSPQEQNSNPEIKANKEQSIGFKPPLNDNIVKTIKDYYQENFGKGARLEETIDDTLIYMTYYNIPKDSNDYEGFLISISIPLIKQQDLFGANPILEGDINNDGISDLVISVHTEGGGAGGNNWSQDIFAFIAENGIFKLVSVTPDIEFSGCDGIFRTEKILDNLIIGRSSCYGPMDARCCPSEDYKTKVIFEKGKLKFLSKSRLK